MTILQNPLPESVKKVQDFIQKQPQMTDSLVAFFDNPMTKEITTVPLARMFTGNPYDEVNPPDSNDPTGFLEGA